MTETLAGRGARIKAYTIATTVFGRAADFDAQIDPIVRIEAQRLRRSLERFYLLAGKSEPLRISMPKGSYVPVFAVAEAPPIGDVGGQVVPSAPLPRPTPRKPSIFVSAFEAEGDRSVFPNFTRGFTRQLIVGLARFEDVEVFGAETSFRYGEAPDHERLHRDLGVDFILTGGTAVSVERFAVDVLLIDARSGRTTWAQSFERPLAPEDIFHVRDEVANRIAQIVAQPYGMIFNAKAKGAEGKPPVALSSYDAVLRFYKYWRTHSREMNGAVRVILEQVVAAEPDYADALACLALVYLDAHRFDYEAGDGCRGSQALDEALRLARVAIQTAPHSSRAHHALGLALWFAGAVPDALRALDAGLKSNPNDTEIMAELGLRHAILAQWEEARPLLARSYAQNPAQSPSYRMGLGFDHYAHRRFMDALIEARQVEAPHMLYGHVLVAMAAAKCGRDAEAASAIERIREIAPDYPSRITEDLTSRHAAPELVEMIVDGLRFAGFFDGATGSSTPHDQQIQAVGR